MKIILIILSLTCFSLAEEQLDQYQVDKNWLAKNKLEIKRMNRDTFNSYSFRLNGENIYMIICDGYKIERVTNLKLGIEASITEHDADRDGKIDGIRIGKDDVTFYSYLISYLNNQVIVQAFPDDWMNGKIVKHDNPYDTFMRFLKYERGVAIE